MKNIMKTLIVSLCSVAVLSFSSVSLAAGGGNKNLDKVYLNMNDRASLKNGADIFFKNCLSCHSAQYARYNRVAEDLDIPVSTLISGDMKEGDLIVRGKIGPDLTLVSRVRKPDWVYTYLRTFYKDESSATGWNNVVFPSVSMAHVLSGMQGEPKLISLPSDEHAEEDAHDDSHGEEGHGPKEVDESVYTAGGATFDMTNRGSMSNAEFDAAMRDVTNFLAYLGEPAQLKRKTIGVWTMVFLIILLLLAIMLKKEYWRDVH